MNKMGRPPAEWMYRMAGLKLPDSQVLDLLELEKIVGVSAVSIKAFFNKIKTKRIHTVIDGRVKAVFKVGDVKKSAKEHVRPWGPVTLEKP